MPKRATRMRLVLTIAVGLASLLVIGVLALRAASTASPPGEAREFISALERGDAAGLAAAATGSLQQSLQAMADSKRPLPSRECRALTGAVPVKSVPTKSELPDARPVGGHLIVYSCTSPISDSLVTFFIWTTKSGEVYDVD